MLKTKTERECNLICNMYTSVQKLNYCLNLPFELASIAASETFNDGECFQILIEFYSISQKQNTGINFIHSINFIHAAFDKNQF